MVNKKSIFSMVGYFIIANFVGAIWHGMLFSAQYADIGMFESYRPLVSGIIVLQSIILAGVYQYLHSKMSLSPWVFAAAVGLFVGIGMLEYIAQVEEMNNIDLFLILQTGAVVLQFALYGAFLKWLYR